jgi:uncharacterized Rossmann fold enzyme
MVMFGPCEWVFEKMIDQFRVDDIEVIISDKPEKGCDIYQFWRPQNPRCLEYLQRYGAPKNSIHMVHESPKDARRANINFRLKTLHHFKTIVCSSQEQYEFYSKHHKNVIYIPFGVFDWAKKKSGINRHKKLRVGFSGRIYGDGVKGETLFTQIVYKLNPNKFELVITSPQHKDLVAKLRRVGCNLTITASADPIHNYPITDVQIIASRFEGTPFGYIENMAIGNHILSTDVGVVKEYTPDSIFNSAAECIAELNKIEQNRDILEKSLDDNPKLVKNLTWDNTITQYQELCHSLIYPKTTQDSVYIIGGGPSVNDFDLRTLRDRDVMAVNAAIKVVPNAKYFVTMDYSFFSKSKIKPQTISAKTPYPYFIINKSVPSLTCDDRGVYTDTRINLKYEGLDNFNKILGHNGSTLGETYTDFVHGDNSGFCAIQLAKLLGYKNIYLIGFDMNDSGDRHFHDDYDDTLIIRNMSKYKKNFNKALKSAKNIYSITPTTLAVNSAQLDVFPLIVAYHTDDPLYNMHAREFERGLTQLGLEYYIETIPTSSWQQGTRYKAKFLRKMLDEVDRPILYVDVDGRIRSKPIGLQSITADIAVRWQSFPWKQNECLSGTIYLKNNTRTKKLCDRWNELNEREGNEVRTFEQWNLDKAIKEVKGLTTYNLPPEYTFIFDSMKKIYPNTKPIIEHFQASRKANT